MDLLIRAKEYTQLPEDDIKYNSYLYLALRYLECSSTEAVNILQRTGRLSNINYLDIFTIHPQSVLGIFTEKAQAKKDRITKFISERKAPTEGTEANIVLLEAILRNPKSPMQFIKSISQIIDELKLCHSKLSEVTIKDFIK